MKLDHSIFQIKYYKSKNISSTTPFKILNHITLCTQLLLDTKK